MSLKLSNSSLNTEDNRSHLNAEHVRFIFLSVSTISMEDTTHNTSKKVLLYNVLAVFLYSFD